MSAKHDAARSSRKDEQGQGKAAKAAKAAIVQCDACGLEIKKKPKWKCEWLPNPQTPHCPAGNLQFCKSCWQKPPVRIQRLFPEFHPDNYDPSFQPIHCFGKYYRKWITFKMCPVCREFLSFKQSFIGAAFYYGGGSEMMSEKLDISYCEDSRTEPATARIIYYDEKYDEDEVMTGRILKVQPLMEFFRELPPPALWGDKELTPPQMAYSDDEDAYPDFRVEPHGRRGWLPQLDALYIAE